MTRIQRRSPGDRRRENGAVQDPEIVLEAAARFLEARARSEAEVRRRLVSAGYPEQLVETVIRRLADLAYIDDAAFARAWVASRDRARPRGARALRLELRQKGVEAGLIEQILAERETAPAGRQSEEVERAEVASARRLLERHRGSLDRVADPRKRRGRTYSLLARHGFDPDAIGQVMAELDESAPDTQDPPSSATGDASGWPFDRPGRRD